MTCPALAVCQITKEFPGVRALDDVTFAIAPNEVVGLIGENGAGKSTLLKILNGVYQPDRGEIRLDGEAITINSARDAFDKGIAMVFQEQSVIASLSVAENLYLAREQEFLRFGLLDKRRMNEAASAELAKVHLATSPKTLIADLSFADRQMVEIAKAVSLADRLDRHVTILLDEPTSVLEQREVDLLFEIIADLKSRTSIVFISHRLDEAVQISDRICVMRDGQMVHETPAKNASIHELHHHMVGRQLHHEYYREASQSLPGDDILLSANGLSQAGAFSDISFDLRQGEVLGIAGVIGSGREALARCLAGHSKPDTGTITIQGQTFAGYDVHKAVQQGIGFVPSERKVEGLVTPFSVAENMTLAAMAQFTRNGFIDGSRERQTARNWVDKLAIKTPSIRTLAASLSGGNQQKTVLAKWRITGVSILILDHPTRGIDVGAKEEVYELVRAMTSQGLAVVLLGDTLDEVIGLSSRVIVMKDGNVSAQFDAPAGAKPAQVDIVEYMV